MGIEEYEKALCRNPITESKSFQDQVDYKEHLNSRKEFKDRTLPKKTFILRNSTLTDLMEVNNLRTVYNISVAVFILAVINIVVLTDTDKFWKNLKSIAWCTNNFFLFLKLWTSFNLFAFLIFFGFKYWVRLRNKINKELVDAWFRFAFVASVVLLFSLTTFNVVQNEIYPITNFILMLEQVRIFMKVYSFVIENSSRVLLHQAVKDKMQEKVLVPTFKHYLYYLFAPVLIYRDIYPRKQGRSYKIILKHMLEFFACIAFYYCFFTYFVMDALGDTGLKQSKISLAFLLSARIPVMGCLTMFLLFYGVLHAWLNAFAELLQFGDREFYQDWWNSTDFAQYYRKWNVIVHLWIHEYLFLQLHKMGTSRTASSVLVVVISGIFHEYIITLSLGFFFPALSGMYTTTGLFVLLLTRGKKGQFWNIFLWIALFWGWGFMISLYSTEWYARMNCPRINDNWTDWFIPRIWSKNCPTISYS